ncbi:MAG TPA: hypothetical protein VHH11_13795 [Gammaproteobacteria bacterium]|nr:hypothetical protein [Gammaproteobacteria bacterium]
MTSLSANGARVRDVGAPVDPTDAARLADVSGGVPAGYYGDGADGPQVFDGGGQTVLTGDLRATTVLVKSNTRLDVAGFEISATVSIEIEAGSAIHSDGQDASGATPGAGSNGTANTLTATCFAVGGGGGSPGQNGNTQVGVQNSETLFDHLGASGGNGGNNGGGGGVTSGWTLGLARHPFMGATPTNLQAFDPNTFATLILPCGSGGGGGGGAGAGAGGGGGGIVRLRAPVIHNDGTISARGGAGGNAPVPATGGGGGGGAGGRVILQGTLEGSGVVDVAGGAGGSGLAPASTAGQAGSVAYFVG